MGDRSILDCGSCQSTPCLYSLAAQHNIRSEVFALEGNTRVKIPQSDAFVDPRKRFFPPRFCFNDVLMFVHLDPVMLMRSPLSHYYRTNYR